MRVWANTWCQLLLFLTYKRPFWFISWCSPLSHRSISPTTDPVHGCVSNLLFEWWDAQGSAPTIDLPASQFVVGSTRLVHYLFPWRRKKHQQPSFHLDALVKWNREGGETERVRQERGRREQIANESLWVGGSISWFEENLTTEDKRLRQCLLSAYLTRH